MKRTLPDAHNFLNNVAEPTGGEDNGELGAMPGWAISDLYPATDSSEFTSDMALAAREAEDFAAQYQGKLAGLAAGPDGPRALYDCLKGYEALQDRMGRIASYAFLNYVTKVDDAARAKFFGDVQEKLTQIGVKVLFLTLELNRIDDEVMDKVIAQPPLDYYRPWLEELRKEKPYQLSDDLERLFHEQNITGRGGWSRLFSETMAALRFDVDGEMLPLEPALNLLMAPDGERRRKAADALTKTFQGSLPLFTLITNTLSKDLEISNRWRGFSDIAAARHLANNVEAEVVEALVTAVREHYPRISHRYYAMKAKWLGMERLEFWDRNAPITSDAERTIAWPEAQEIILSAYRRFSPDMSDIARMFFDNSWIDAPVRPGKSPGAFAHPTVPSAHPFVLLNYMGKPRDVMTLAHELGHGVHQVLANEQGALMAGTPLTLAETASVFGEMLTFKSLLDATPDRAQRKTLLAQKTEDKINTVIRQIAFYEFERRLHTERLEGELTAERIGALWVEVQADSLGPAVNLGEGYDVYWTYVPHFIHSPFYVYAYAFGDCLVNSLYAVYENGEDGFQKRYFDMLRAGGTKHHKELLAPFGLNASDPGFWAMGLKVIEDMVDELETYDEG
ncbi:MAG: M3 family oligoendopeptidase [Hyphomicrobiales bacterium]|nr:M3 family oligoendopeptidase [Hyphomicrobiales bacterium]